MITKLSTVALAVLALTAAPAYAQLISAAPPSCSNNDVDPNSFACSGAWNGNDANQQAGVLAELNKLLPDPNWSFAGKSDDANNGPFTGNPDDTGDGTLTFDNPINGNFGIALKSGNAFSLYVWKGASNVASIDFNTIGVRGGRDLSRASLYVGTIPEPETYALFLAGLAGVAFMARRRKSV